MKKLALIALAVLIALPASAAGVTISGYIDVGYLAAQGGGASGSTAVTQGAASGSTNGNMSAANGFALNEVNIDIAAQLTNDISAFVSLDAAAQGNNPARTSARDGGAVNYQDNANNAAGAVTVDYAYVDFANPGPFDLNVRAGRIPSVVGIEQRVSESNQNKFINLSLASPITVGSQDGVAIYGSFSPVNYAIAFTNSDNLRRVAAIPGDNLDRYYSVGIRPSNNNGVANVATNDNNNAKNLSGRLGVVPIEGLEIGVSAGLDRPTSSGMGLNQSLPKKYDRSLIGVDASYTYGALNLKGEWVRVRQEMVNATNATGQQYKGNLSAWYVEGVYDFSNKYSVGVRYNRQRLALSGIGAACSTAFDINSLQFAGVYRVADNVELKAEYDINKENILDGQTVPANAPKLDNNVFALSLVGSF